MKSYIPTIDISSLLDGKFVSKEARKTILSIKKACVEVGFFQIIGHGLKNEEIKNICAVGNKFFNMEDKYKRKLSPKKWNKQKLLDFYVIHLGETGENWQGRVTDFWN